MKEIIGYIIFAWVVGAIIGAGIYHTYVCAPCDEGRAVIDAKEWHVERDSLMELQADLVARIKADSVRRHLEDSVTAVRATARMERLNRVTYRHARAGELDSVLRLRYGYERKD